MGAKVNEERKIIRSLENRSRGGKRCGEITQIRGERIPYVVRRQDAKEPKLPAKSKHEKDQLALEI
jgi:hypothetical protein